MKQRVTLITCDDYDKTQATSMHEITLTINGSGFAFDACSQGCAARLVHAKLIEVLEGPGAKLLREDPPEHPDDARMRLEVRD